MKQYMVAEECGLKTPNGRLTLNNAGNVAIGTNTPSQLLTLNATSDPFIHFNTSGTNRSAIGFQTSALNGFWIESTTVIAFYTGGTNERMCITSGGQVGIGTNNPVASALLDLTSTTGGLLLPRMTTTQRNALTGTDGLVIFNTTTNQPECYYSSTWNAM